MRNLHCASRTLRKLPLEFGKDPAVIRQAPPADDLVPQGVDEQSRNRPFATLVRNARAVVQITRSFSLNWPAPAQRFRSKRFAICLLYSCRWQLGIDRRLYGHPNRPQTLIFSQSGHSGLAKAAVRCEVLQFTLHQVGSVWFPVIFCQALTASSVP